MEAKEVTLATFLTVTTAEIARIALENEGIPCYIADQHQAAHPVGSLIGVRLQVFADDYAEARAILEESGLYTYEDKAGE